MLTTAVLSGDRTANSCSIHLPPCSGEQVFLFMQASRFFKSSVWTVEHFRAYTPWRVSMISVSFKMYARASYCKKIFTTVSIVNFLTNAKAVA